MDESEEADPVSRNDRGLGKSAKPRSVEMLFFTDNEKLAAGEGITPVDKVGGRLNLKERRLSKR